MPYPDTAIVETEGGRIGGCGGDTVDLIAGPEWVVEDILGDGVIDGSRVTMAFGDRGRFSGQGGCNNFTGSFRISAEGTSFGPVAATMKACAEALMNQERKFINALSGVSRFDIDDTGALLMIAGDEVRIRARRG